VASTFFGDVRAAGRLAFDIRFRGLGPPTHRLLLSRVVTTALQPTQAKRGRPGWQVNCSGRATCDRRSTAWAGRGGRRSCASAAPGAAFC